MQDEREAKLAELKAQIAKLQGEPTKPAYGLSAEETAEAMGSHSLPLSPQPEPRRTYEDTEKAWLSEEGRDFVTPSGKLCRVRDMPVEKLAALGILDQLTRLPGITEGVVNKAEGMPPEKMRQGIEQLVTISEMLNRVVPLIVMKPTVWALPEEGEERQPGRIYVDSISLPDRIAILNEAAGGVMKFDNFRG